ncbi:C39 family peptidase [Candidatus Nomurabacteria bacterium]|nr:C39 family peptidase [Candidatus Nomurabacteria bacterium]
MNIHLNLLPFQETLHADMCGPASLKIILSYYGIEKTESELAKLTNLIPGLGIDDVSIVKTAEELGFKTEIKNESSLKDIATWLEKGVPVIVDWFTRGRSDYSDSEVADGHYSVVCGLDDTHIYLQDPEIGSIRKIEHNDFMKVWFDFKGNVLKSDELIIRQIIAIYK